MRKSILITGATSGLGRYLAGRLADQCLLVHGRDPERTKRLADELGAHPYVADLSDLSQVSKLAAAILRDFGKIDVLINNAGIGYGKERELSVDGHELRFAVNYLAPVLLTRLLLDNITETVLNIGSLGQESLDIDDLTIEHGYSGVTAYRRAKLALAMATFDLAKERPDLRVNVVHPATYMDTNMVRKGGGVPLNTVDHGGEATLRVLQSPLSGTFFDEDKPSKAHPDAYDEGLRARLHRETDLILGVS
jgi:NAD(P)-dependent dehydrogenase (short-subunit alcohol dehydrogenase family)